MTTTGEKLSRLAPLLDDTGSAARDSVANLAALDSVAEGTVVRLQAGGRSGPFRATLSDISTEVAADTQQGIYIAFASDPTGASGGWVRQDFWPIEAGVYGSDSEATDNAVALQAFFNAVVSEGYGQGNIAYGEYSVSGDLTIPAAAEGTRTSRNLLIRGDGPCSVFAFDGGSDRVTGTALNFAPGGRLVLPVNRSATMLERLSIVGSVDGDALIKGESTGFNDWPNLGGGLTDCLVINDLRSTPVGLSYCATMTSVYGAIFNKVYNYGRADAGEIYSNSAIAWGDLYFGRGWRISTKGGGALGEMSQITFTGFDLALDIGETVADWSGGVEMDLLTMYMPEISTNWRGIDIKRGVKKVVLDAPHLEFNGNFGVRVRSAAGDVRIKDGGGGEVSRAGPSGTEFPALGQIVCGDSIASESLWGSVRIDNFDFRTIRQCGVFIFGGSGDVVVDGCTGNNNGGFFIGFDTATEGNGYPNLWVKNIDDSLNVTRGRFIARVTRGAAYSAHSANGDYRWMARIENCGLDSAGDPYDSEIELPVDLDFSVRKWPPVSCFVNTLSTSRQITLGTAVPCSMSCTIEKRFAPNSLDVVVPSGVVLRDQFGNTWTGVTQSFTAVGYYKFTRQSDDKWLVEIT